MNTIYDKFQQIIVEIINNCGPKQCRMFSSATKSRCSYYFPDFRVESYLEYQGRRFGAKFDANSYLYLSKAVDYFDLERQYGSLENAFAKTNTKFLFISFSSDWLFPTKQIIKTVYSIAKIKKDGI